MFIFIDERIQPIVTRQCQEKCMFLQQCSLLSRGSNKKCMYIMCYARRFIRYTQSWNSNNLKIFWSKKIKEPKHNSQTRLILHISDVVRQPIKIMKRKFNFNFLDRCLFFCLCFFFPTLCCLSANLRLLITPLVSSSFSLSRDS